jgi:hypothetical protein
MGALNSLQMWNGFSSHQLVFGKNLNLPNIMQAELHALEGTTCSEAFSKHLNALHEIRKAYIQTVITVITLLLIILCGIVHKVRVDFTQSVWQYSNKYSSMPDKYDFSILKYL